MKKTIYNNVFTWFTDKVFDEKLCINQLCDTINTKKYCDILKENGIDAADLPSTELLNKENRIKLVPERNKFTFIDLFAGSGRFRIVMQNLGGQYVFYSVWVSHISHLVMLK